MLIIRRLNCINTASGIVTVCRWPFGAQVARELKLVLLRLYWDALSQEHQNFNFIFLHEQRKKSKQWMISNVIRTLWNFIISTFFSSDSLHLHTSILLWILNQPITNMHTILSHYILHYISNLFLLVK
jgi:hypothetical protein